MQLILPMPPEMELTTEWQPTTCANCNEPLPARRKKWCSDRCAYWGPKPEFIRDGSSRSSVARMTKLANSFSSSRRGVNYGI